MQLLEKRIIQDGEILPGNILKVSNFLNHQIDVNLMEQLGEEFFRLYKNSNVTKVLTIESSGIAVGYAVARKFGVPLVFAKKHKSSNVNEGVYSSKVWSFTHNQAYTVVVSKKYINKGDEILIVDDFLANGNALKGLIEIVEQAEARVSGICIAIEKCFQNGGSLIRNAGYRVESLAAVEKMTDDGKIIFRK